MKSALLLVLTAVCFSVSGEVLLKRGMNKIGEITWPVSGEAISNMIHTWDLYGGFGLIGVGALFWLAAISRVDLSWAYPLLASGYVLILICSALFLNEQVSLVRWSGAGLIVVGVYLISRS
jgi:multidrug transporter EmrE-like cation transporter